ncbi:glycosyltransferase family protein [Terriglobus albidus]|uniref:hypothetical protein n=1 Tax=Terriglobus albidus TaxID=1592106 RepID=UPI0021E005A6|nr:hypothetical protein [Terriglobus albidus]
MSPPAWKRQLAPAALIAVAAFLAVLPLVLHGCSCGHDFDFHLVNWLEVHAQFQRGVLHPQWAFTAAWGAGEPRFVFYPPLSWVIGGLLGFLMPYTVAPIVYTWLCLFLAGVACLHMVSAVGGDSVNQHRWIPAAIAVTYLGNPYLLFTAYERTAYAELLAAAWMPLLLTALLRERPRWLEIAIPVALLWLTNAPAAVLGCYGLLMLGLLRLVLWPSALRRGTITQFTLGTLFGLLFAAFYIVPAVLDRKWVQAAMAMVEGMRPKDNFLFGHTTDPLHDTVLWQASRIAVVLFAVSLPLVLLLRRDRRARLLGAMTLMILLLLLPVSAVVWHHAPQLGFLQFPWRFLCLQQTIAAVLLTLSVPSLTRIRKNWIMPAGAVAVLAATTVIAHHFYLQQCDEEDAPAAHIALFARGSGVMPTDEYTVRDADNDALQQGNPVWWIAAKPDAPAPALGPGTEMRMRVLGLPPRPEDVTWNTEHTRMQVLWPRSFWLIVNRRAYPAWQVTNNGAPVPITERADGLMAIPLPAGPNDVEIHYHHTPAELLGLVLFFMGILTAILVHRIESQHGRTPL